MRTYSSILLFLILTLSNGVYASQHSADSIAHKLATASGDRKVDLYIELFDAEFNQNPDTAFYHINQAHELAKKIKYDKGFIKTLVRMAMYHDNSARYNASAKKLVLAYNRAMEIKDSALMASTAKNLAEAYYKTGDFDKGLTLALDAITLNERMNNKKGAYDCLNICGNIYVAINNFDKAVECFNKNLPIAYELKDDKKIATVLNNTGLAFQGQKKYKEALDYFAKAMAYSKKIDDNWIAASYLNIGIAYGNLNEDQKAIEHFKLTLEICKRMHFDIGLIYANNYLGEVYVKLKDYKKAIEYLNAALAIGEKAEAKPELSETYDYLARAYRNLQDYKKADEYYQLYTLLKDSMLNESSANQITEMQAKYDSEKQEQAIELLNKDAEIKEAELGKSNMMRNFSIGVALLVLVLVFVLFRSNKNKQKANEVLTQQKSEISTQRDFIESQKNVLEYQKQEITDSINYARRIQNAILPPLNELNRYLPESFVSYMPKDIVAGDFYWIEKVNDVIFFAAADCTGHGVPGAMVSVICNNALNRALHEFEIRTPGKLLDKTREIVIGQFEKSGEEVKDGMDISFCALNTKTNELSWSGANNPLWLIRNDVLTEIKPDKQPIGKYAALKPYTTHTVTVEKGDAIYVFTDGFADQFGGEKGKKYKSSVMKELLKRIFRKGMPEQKMLITKEFNEWKAGLDQVDDVCIIGLRI